MSLENDEAPTRLVSGRGGHAQGVQDPAIFRDVLGHFPTGVVAVTALTDAGEPVGMTVGSFTSVSLDPPLVGFLPARSSSTFRAIAAAGSFCVNFLARDQESICRSFATRGKNRFSGVAWESAPSGAPILRGCLGWIDCTIQSVQEVGDHYFVVGEVGELGRSGDTTPLLFFRGGYGAFSSRSLTAPAERDLVDQLRYVDFARAEMEALSERLGLGCMALALVDEEVAIVGTSEPTNSRQLARRVGQRWPCDPPFGGVFVAWAQPSAQQAWLDRAGPESTPADLTAYRQILDRIRTRGWSLSLTSQSQLDLLTAIETIPRVARSAEQGQALHMAAAGVGPQWHEPAHLEDDVPYEVRILGVPVFDRRGRPLMELSLFPIPQPLSAQQIHELVDNLHAAARRIEGVLRAEVDHPAVHV